MRHTSILVSPVQARQALADLWTMVKPMVMSGHRLILDIRPETRTTAQNARMWAMLTEVSRQVTWYGKRLTPEDWKHVFTASLRKLDVVPNLDGSGFVALGMSTSNMDKGEMAELMDLIEAFGAQQDVKFQQEEAVTN